MGVRENKHNVSKLPHWPSNLDIKPKNQLQFVSNISQNFNISRAQW